MTDAEATESTSTPPNPTKTAKRLRASDKIVRIRDVQIGIVERLDSRYAAAMEKASSLHAELLEARAELARLELSLPEGMRTPYMPMEEVLIPLPPLNVACETRTDVVDQNPAESPA